LSEREVIAGSAAYDFSNSATQEAEADERVANIAGATYTKSKLCICGNQHFGALLSEGVFNALLLKGSIKNMDHPSAISEDDLKMNDLEVESSDASGGQGQIPGFARPTKAIKGETALHSETRRKEVQT